MTVKNKVRKSSELIGSQGIVPISNKVFKYIHWLMYKKKHYKNICETDARGDKIIWINSNDVKYKSTLLDNDYVKPKYVIDGHWDISALKFVDSTLYKIVEEKYQKNIYWDKTDKYDQLIKKYGDPEFVQNKLEKIDTIYEEITNSGYKTQKELLQNTPAETKRRCNDWDNPLFNEIGVCVGRDGTLFQDGGGQKRFVVAKYLGISSLPVQVRVRHKRWQDLRNKIKSVDKKNMLNSIEKSQLQHPDLQDIVPQNW